MQLSNPFSSGIIFSIVLVLSSSALAHHSHGNYQMGQMIQLEGVVTELVLRNPHVWVFMEVEDEMGKGVVWAMEGGGISSFSRAGWDRVAAGDNLSVECTPTRDGARGCFITDIVVRLSEK